MVRESTYYGEEVIGHPNHHVRIRRLMPRTVTRVFDQHAPRCPCRCSTWYSSETAMNFDGPPGGRTQQKSLGLTSKSELTMVESQELSLSHINMKIISKYMMMTLMMRTQQSWIQKYGGDKDCFGLISIFFVGDIILYIIQIQKIKPEDIIHVQSSSESHLPPLIRCLCPGFLTSYLCQWGVSLI